MVINHTDKSITQLLQLFEYSEAIDLNIIIGEYEPLELQKVENEKKVYSNGYLTRGRIIESKTDNTHYSDVFYLKFKENGKNYNCSSKKDPHSFEYVLGDKGDTISNGSCIAFDYIPNVIKFLNSDMSEAGRLKLKKEYKMNVNNNPDVSFSAKLNLFLKAQTRVD
jgi:hypothetical protein